MQKRVANVFLLCVLICNETPLFKAAELRNQKSQGEYRGILDQLYSSISGFFGGSDAKDPSSSQVAHDDIIITPPPFPDKSNPHYKPGTTNNGGMLNKIVATMSGITSGIFGAVGANRGGPVHFLKQASTLKPNILESNANQHDSGLVHDDKTPSLIPQIPSFSIPQNPLGGIFSNILQQVDSCSEIRKLLGQC